MTMLPVALNDLLIDRDGNAAGAAFLAHIKTLEAQGIREEDICWGIIRAVMFLCAEEYDKWGPHRVWSKKFLAQWGDIMDKEAEKMHSESLTKHYQPLEPPPTILDDKLEYRQFDDAARERVKDDFLQQVRSQQAEGVSIEPICRGLIRAVISRCKEQEVRIYASSIRLHNRVLGKILEVIRFQDALAYGSKPNWLSSIRRVADRVAKRLHQGHEAQLWSRKLLLAAASTLSTKASTIHSAEYRVAGEIILTRDYTAGSA